MRQLDPIHPPYSTTIKKPRRATAEASHAYEAPPKPCRGTEAGAHTTLTVDHLIVGVQRKLDDLKSHGQPPLLTEGEVNRAFDCSAKEKNTAGGGGRAGEKWGR